MRSASSSFVWIVGDDDGDAAGCAQSATSVFAQRTPQRHVYIGERLVEQHHARGRRERPRQGNALLLPARQSVRIALRQALQRHGPQVLRCDTPALACAQVAQTELDVLAHRLVRKEHVFLENEANRTLFRRRRAARLAQCLTVEQNPPGLHPFQAGGQPQQGALAAAGRAEQAGDLACTRFEVQVPQHDLGTVAVAHVREAQAHGGAVYRLLGRAVGAVGGAPGRAKMAA